MGFPVGPPLFLPEWHRFFDSINCLTACREGVLSMCGAHCDADRDVSNAEPPDPMGRSDPDVRMLGPNTLQHQAHLFVREAFVGFIVEPGDRLSARMVTDDTEEDADAPRSGALNRFSDFVERDLLIADPAKNDGRTAGNRWHDVDAIAIAKHFARIDEISVDRQPHAFDEGPERRKPGRDRLAQIGLRHAWGGELERGTLAPCKLPGGGIVVNANPHGVRKA